MNRSIENLMAEHRLIEKVLGALETFAHQLARNPALPRESVAQFAAFFRNFADKCHHGKEEDRLFAKMVQHGFPKEYGPIGVMQAEHNQGRVHVRALDEIGRGSGPLTPREIQQVTEHALAFSALLRSHIQKEDHVLYPMALQAIPPPELAALDQSCAAFEQEVMGADEIAKLTDLAINLTGAYPPDPVCMATSMGCAGCGGH
jgi:hemerythrin-like domain-containing protein